MATKKSKKKMFPEFLFVNREVESSFNGDYAWYAGHEDISKKNISLGSEPQHIATYRLETVEVISAVVDRCDSTNPDVD